MAVESKADDIDMTSLNDRMEAAAELSEVDPTRAAAGFREVLNDGQCFSLSFSVSLSPRLSLSLSVSFCPVCLHSVLVVMC